MFALDELDRGKEMLFNAAGRPTPSPWIPRSSLTQN